MLRALALEIGASGFRMYILSFPRVESKVHSSDVKASTRSTPQMHASTNRGLGYTVVHLQ